MKHILSLLLMVSVSLSLYAQHHVRGTVVESNGEPIIGVSVVVVGTTTGATTDLDGNFDINAPKAEGKLKVSYVGYTTQEVPYVAGKPLNIVLLEDNQNLEEVVVVGFGTQKKANLTGAVASVDNKLLDNRPLTNLSSGLAGLLPGVSVVQTSGQPGQDVGTINIRGIGTFNQSGPLVIIDGFEGSLNDVNPNDVANISVLKDAASSSIYGSKAANGVILVTTKRGQSGKPTLSYQGLVGTTKATAYPEFMESAEIAEKWNLAHKSVGLDPMFTEAEIQKYRDGSDPDNYSNTDWQGLLYKTGMQTSHNVTMSGGTDNAKYLASVGYLYQDGIINHYNKNQANARVNVDINPSKNVETSWSINYIRSSVNEPLPSYNTSWDTGTYGGQFGSSNSVYQIIRQINVISPMVPNKYSDGSYGRISDGNPIAWVEDGGRGNAVKSNLQGIGSIKVYILPELSIKAAASYTKNENENNVHNVRIQYKNGAQGTTEVAFTTTAYERSVLDITPEYKKSFGGHNVNVLAGYHAEVFKYRYNQTYRTGLPNNVVTDINAGTSSTAKANGNTRELAMLSWFGRFAWDYKGRYLFEANARYDGSSRFAEDNRWGFFPSFSAGWRLSDEAFFEPLKEWVSNMKIRASWGKLGNQDLGSYYPTISTMSLGYGNIFGGSNFTNGAKTVSAVNKNLKWEATTTMGVGIDANIWKFGATLDLYEKKTTGILMAVSTPSTFALSGFYDNIGEVRNRGIEFDLNYNDRFGDFTFGAGINGCYNINKVLDLGKDYASGEAIEYIGANIDQTSARHVVGRPMNQFYGYQVDGFLKANETKPHSEGGWADYEGSAIRRAGDLKFVDQNNDGKINADDRVYLGSMDPKFTFGLHFNVGWKNWSLIAFFQGAANVHRYMGDALGQFNVAVWKPNVIWRDSYTFKGEGAKYPNMGIPGYNYSGNGGLNSFWLQNASYMRLKDLQVGYDVPKKVLAKIGVTNCHIYYSGQNLLTFSGMIKGFDPEMPSGRGNGYPLNLVNSLGVNVTF